MDDIPAVKRLSPRQRQCLELVGQLRGSKEIAAELGLSPRTVDSYISEAVVLLGARDRRHAARLIDVDGLTPEKIRGQTPGVFGAVSVAPTAGPPDAVFGASNVEELQPRTTIWDPDRWKPPMRILLILAGMLVAAITLGAMVNLVEDLNRLAATLAH